MGMPIWSMWAHYMAICAAVCVIPGGVIAIWYPTWDFFLPYYAIGAGVFVLIWDFPLPGLTRLGFLFNSLYIRAILYILLSGPMFLDAPTTTGALTLVVTGAVNLIGAVSGEKYCHPNDYHKRPSKSKKSKVSVVEHEHTKVTKSDKRPESSRVLTPEDVAGVSASQQV